MDTGDWESWIESVVSGRRVILAGEVVAAWTPLVPVMYRLGAAGVIVYGPAGRGVGEVPDDAEWVAAEAQADTLMESIRAGEANLAAPPAHVLDALDRFDPDHDAVVIGTWLNTAPELDGRPFLAHRRSEWLALEDKTVIDDFWDRTGVERAASRVVPAKLEALQSAAGDLDQGSGTVWSGDSRDGFNGGASYVRWVRSPADAAVAADFFTDACDKVRVMPFLDGPACSIHGIVFADDVVALRPVEMLTLRRPDSPELFYCGCASTWDPSPAIRSEMRDLARAAGEQLRAEVDFRGFFTVDGVLTPDGFLPTELNPRAGAGLRTLTGGLSGLPLTLLVESILAQPHAPFEASTLENLIIDSADNNRFAATWATVKELATEAENRPIARTAEGLRWATDEEPFAHVMAGVSDNGGFVRFSVDPDLVPESARFAPIAAELWAFANQNLGTNLGLLYS